MNIRQIIFGGIAVVVLVAGGYTLYARYLAPEPEVTTTPIAEISPLETSDEDVISAEGKITPLNSGAFSFQIGGEIAELLVAEGDTVQAGDPLIRLKDTDLALAVQQANAALAQAQANKTAVEAQLAAAQEGVNTAQIGVTAAQAQLDLAQSAPQAEAIAAAQSSVNTASALISQAAANRDATLEVPTSRIRAAQAQVAAAQAEARVLQDQYDAVSDIGGTPEEQARFALNAANAQVAAAQAALDEVQAGATEAQKRAANAAVSVASAQKDAAQAQLDLLLAGAKPEQIAIAEVGVQQAQAAVAQAETAVTLAEAAVAQAEAGVVQAQTAVDMAQAALQKATLTAPFGGVVADLMVDLGQVVAPGFPVVTLGDLSGWQVETTDLTELDIVSVAEGQTVQVRVDALPNQTLAGTVRKIATTPSLSRGDVTYTITILLQDTENLPLRWGMTAFVDVRLAK